MFIEEASKKILESYIAILKRKNIKAICNTENPLSLEHVYWMCCECNKSIDVKNKKNAWSVDKYSRWIGFIQAALVMHKITTVDEERDKTREWLK
ncbi:MAG: hypothetical protein COA52_00650 [Hyphomicrobiales bacterium]|nr:MAG: hypothetical protein COA52_00650 [Hyphomicrobiales bacterium]